MIGRRRQTRPAFSSYLSAKLQARLEKAHDLTGIPKYLIVERAIDAYLKTLEGEPR